MAIRSAKVKDASSLTWDVPSFHTPEYIRIRRKLTASTELHQFRY